MAEWDDENFEPQGLAGGGLSNKWEGEDEEDTVKDSWEDEEEERKMPPKEPIIIEEKQKPRKKLQEIIAEKEKLKKEEHEKRTKEQEEEEISPEEQLRRQKESDLKVALETTFGVDKGVDGQPTNKEEFLELAESLSRNLQQFTKNEEYPVFAENLVRGVCATLNSFDLKKIKTTIDNLYLEKQKIEKGDKLKKNKGKGKAKLKMDGDNLNQYSAYVDDYDYEEFM